MHHLIDLETYPLDRPDSAEYASLVARCRDDIANDGMFNLSGFLRPGVAQAAADAASPTIKTAAFKHARWHNVYFKKHVDGIAQDHPALKQVRTENRTLCGDQLSGNPILDVYEWGPMADFLAKTMGKEQLFTMDDKLARINVQATREGEGLNWHFDRSEFTTTILLQAPEIGGQLEYRKDLRSHDDPNFDGVAKLLAGKDPLAKRAKAEPGALNVFKGVNTIHRVVPVVGSVERVVAIFSYFDRPGVLFSPEEQKGFYGRAVS